MVFSAVDKSFLHSFLLDVLLSTPIRDTQMHQGNYVQGLYMLCPCSFVATSSNRVGSIFVKKPYGCKGGGRERKIPCKYKLHEIKKDKLDVHKIFVKKAQGTSRFSFIYLGYKRADLLYAKLLCRSKTFRTQDNCRFIYAT